MRRPIALAALALALASAPAAAQTHGAASARRPADHRADSNSLRAQLGIPVALRLLASDDFASRVRGIERLGAIGTKEAVDALVDAIDSSSVSARDPRVRLIAVRALAGEAKRDNVRQLLQNLVVDSSGADGRSGAHPLTGLVRGTAALALARAGDGKAVAGLVKAALQGGAAGEAALRALRTYPAASFDALLDGQKRLTPPLATLLGELGDLRALDKLRALLAEGGPELTKGEPPGRSAAAVALARLGDEAALPVARGWLLKSEPRLRRAAAEVFVYLDAPEAPAAVAALLESDATHEDGLRLSLLAPAPSLAAPLAKALPDLPEELRGRAVAALGRAGGVTQLVPLLDKPDSALAAAFALAILPGDEARAALEGALRASDTPAHPGGYEARRQLARAGVVRALVLDDAPSGLKDALRALFKATDPADRAAGAFGLVATGALSLTDALEASCKTAGEALACDATAGAAARGALALPDGAGSLEPLFPLLARLAGQAHAPGAPEARSSGDEPLAVALGAALLAHPDGGDLPTSVLAAWAEAGGPLAPLAARALPSRDDEALRGRIKRLLEGTDPVVRAHVALGLGRSPEASAVSLLTSAYRLEEDAGVRRAVVRGLSLRAEVQRVATLTLARDLDPDAEVRSLARAALDGRALDPGVRPALGPEPRRSVAWVSIQPNDGRSPLEGHQAPARAARVVRADGVAVPAVADPDGALLVPGLPAGPASLLLGRAPEPR